MDVDDGGDDRPIHSDVSVSAAITDRTANRNASTDDREIINLLDYVAGKKTEAAGALVLLTTRAHNERIAVYGVGLIILRSLEVQISARHFRLILLLIN